MSFFGKEGCARCMTTHPQNEQGERVCPKPPIEETPSDKAPAVIFKGSGFYATDSRRIRSQSDVL